MAQNFTQTSTASPLTHGPTGEVAPRGAGHRLVGSLYLGFAVIAALVGVALSVVMRADLQGGAGQAPLSSMLVAGHGMVMIFFVAMPALVGGFGSWFVPLLIGAGEMAFPRLNAWGFWLLVPALLMLLAAPFAAAAALPGAVLVLGAFLLAALSTLLASANLVVTIINMRAPGISLHRMPLFVWSELVTACLLLVAMPVLTGAISMLLIQNGFGSMARMRLGPFQHLFWFFGHPEVYVLLLPAFGIVSHVVSTFCGRPLLGRFALAYVLLAMALGGFLLWAQALLGQGAAVDVQGYFRLAMLVIAVPAMSLVASWLGTLFAGPLALPAGGRRGLPTPLLFALGFIFVFAVGGLTALLRMVTGGTEQGDAGMAQFHYVLSLGAVFAILAGFYFWIMRISGRPYPERLGRVHFWLTFIGVNLTFAPMQFLGPQADTAAAARWGLLSNIGMALSVAGFLVFLYLCYRILRSGERAQINPWGRGATTLEWQAPHGPMDAAPEGDWAAQPAVVRVSRRG